MLCWTPYAQIGFHDIIVVVIYRHMSTSNNVNYSWVEYDKQDRIYSFKMPVSLGHIRSYFSVKMIHPTMRLTLEEMKEVSGFSIICLTNDLSFYSNSISSLKTVCLCRLQLDIV